MQDRHTRPDNRNLGHRTPSLHPRTINGTPHAITFLASLMSIAEEATLQATQLREADDLYLAAANVDCTTIYLRIVEPVIDQYVQDERGFAALRQATADLADIQNLIIQDAGDLPLYQDTVNSIRADVHALLVLRQVEVIQYILASEGQGMPEWNEAHHEAHVSTAQFLTHQFPFDDPDTLPDPRPDLTQQAAAAKAKATEITDTITREYLTGMPVKLSPATAAMPDVQPIPDTGPLSPSFPRFGLHFISASDQQPEGPVASMTFVHRNTIYMKTITEPYPSHFPQDLAEQYAAAAADTILPALRPEDGPRPFQYLDHLTKMVRTMQTAAKLGLHTATPAQLRAIIKSAKDAKLSRGARSTLIEALMDYHSHLANTLLQDPAGSWRKRVTKTPALKVLHTARQNGADAHTLGELAIAMGYRPSSLDVKVPSLAEPQLGAIKTAVRRAGLPQSASDRIIDILL